MTKLQSFLYKQAIFSALDDSQKETLLKERISRTYPKGIFIAQMGDIWPYLFIVLSGDINAVKESNEGSSLIVATFNPGDIFWGWRFSMRMPLCQSPWK